MTDIQSGHGARRGRTATGRSVNVRPREDDVTHATARRKCELPMHAHGTRRRGRLRPRTRRHASCGCGWLQQAGVAAVLRSRRSGRPPIPILSTGDRVVRYASVRRRRRRRRARDTPGRADAGCGLADCLRESYLRERADLARPRRPAGWLHAHISLSQPPPEVHGRLRRGRVCMDGARVDQSLAHRR